MLDPQGPPTNARASTARRFAVRAGWLACALALTAVGARAYHLFLGTNCHAVIPGVAYRCAQLSASELEKTVQRYGIRTVINLRGCCAPQDWYLAEARTLHHLDVAMEDVSMSAGRFPSTRELRYLVEVLDRCEYPVLIHCKQGADRTGLTSALLLLLKSNQTWEQAAAQLSLRYGHIALGRPENLDRFLALYGRWLGEEERPHSPTSLRDWLARPDCPMEYRAEFDTRDFPRSVARGKPFALKLRTRNCGHGPWTLQSESNAGYHACFALRDPDGVVCFVGRAGLFDAVVEPKQSIDLTLAFPALNRPGRYHLLVDMLDEVHCIFYQTGGEPLEWDFEVH